MLAASSYRKGDDDKREPNETRWLKLGVPINVGIFRLNKYIKKERNCPK